MTRGQTPSCLRFGDLAQFVISGSRGLPISPKREAGQCAEKGEKSMIESLQILREQLIDIRYLIDHIADLIPENLVKMKRDLEAKIQRLEGGFSE